MTYKILIKNTDSKLKNLWEVYGTTTISGSITTFLEYSTTDVEELQKTIASLDAEIGFDNIRVISDVTYTIKATVDIVNVSDSE